MHSNRASPSSTHPLTHPPTHPHTHLYIGEDLNWHTDWSNSLLHLSLGLGKGKRGLHLKCTEKEKEEEEEEEEKVVWLEQGEAYLTTPTFFEHAVEYPLTEKWEERVIAVQV